MTISAYPLQWPTGWKRTDSGYRKRAAFGKSRGASGSGSRLQRVSISDGIERVLEELRRIGVERDDMIVSTNCRTRLDGFPRGDQGEPGDPGAAVYWEVAKGTRRVMAIDRYDRVADNLAAIAATLEAMRAIERHGGAAILERAFTGFAALPAPDAPREWWDVLECRRDAGAEVVLAQYRRLRSDTHPDRKGGDTAKFDAVQKAYNQAVAEGRA